jgi:hypothetical protein
MIILQKEHSMLDRVYHEITRIGENIPRSDHLLPYYHKVFFNTTKDFVDVEGICRDILINRRATFTHIPALGRDENIFKSRVTIINENDRFFQLISKKNPSVRDLEELSNLGMTWSLLIILKIYLIHNPHLAKDYRGFLPLGSPIIRSYNNLVSNLPSRSKADNPPTDEDYVAIRDEMNNQSDIRGLSTVYINHEMYMEGMKM